MPRLSKAIVRNCGQKTLIVDNGGYSIKAGFLADNFDLENDCCVIPNCLAKGQGNKVWIGSQLDSCTDFAEMSFRRPVQKGYIVNWEAEREIWEKSFFERNSKLHCDPDDTNLLLTEAPNCPAVLSSNCDQMVFEEFEFAAYRRCIGPSLNAHNDIPSIFGDPPRSGEATHAVPAECLLVVDAGYSHTVVAPLYNGQPIQQAVRRLEVGGKFITNYLKEILSLRQMDVRDETHMINRMKEQTCFVSRDLKHDLDKTWKGRPRSQNGDNTIVLDYVLPDYTNQLEGKARPHDPKTSRMMSRIGAITGPTGVQEYIMTLGNERFSPPEILFNPTDIGLKQAGVPELVMDSVSACPTGLWNALLSNILVVGGCANLPGFVERVFDEVRQLAPVECTVRVVKARDPVKSTWLGAARLASDRAAFRELLVTKQEYEEHGSSWLAKKFAALG